jgi:hypothetical protein
VKESRQRQFLRSHAAADRVVSLKHAHGQTDPRQLDRCSQTIRAGSDDRGIKFSRSHS